MVASKCIVTVIKNKKISKRIWQNLFQQNTYFYICNNCCCINIYLVWSKFLLPKLITTYDLQFVVRRAQTCYSYLRVKLCMLFHANLMLLLWLSARIKFILFIAPQKKRKKADTKSKRKKREVKKHSRRAARQNDIIIINSMESVRYAACKHPARELLLINS